jgi:hypothetical protein
MDDTEILESIILVEGKLLDLDLLTEKIKKKAKEVDFDNLIRTQLTRTIDEPEDELHKKFYAALHSNVLDIWFTKKNKRYRKIRGTLNPEMIPPDQHGKGLVDRSKKYWFINLYDLKKKDWRTIRLDYIDKIRHVKRVETPQYNAKIFENFKPVDFYGNET